MDTRMHFGVAEDCPAILALLHTVTNRQRPAVALTSHNIAAQHLP